MKRMIGQQNQTIFNTNTKKTMSAVNFLYWLHGAMERSDKRKFSLKQVEMIKSHLSLVKDNAALTGWFEGFLATQKKVIQGEAYNILEKKIEENFQNLSQFSIPDLGGILKREPGWLDTKIIC